MSGGVWIVKEIADIDALLDEAHTRSMSLSMKLAGHAENLRRSGHASGGLPLMATDAGRAQRTAADLASAYEQITSVRDHMAQTLKRSVDLISEQAE